ncbi:hypothetical protein AAHC03_05801 [Spirometra sp. Aus1]
MVKTAELICGVCGDLFRNPHRLPCGHSFCRRPCLLPTPSSTRASCIHCNTQFHVSELERNCELDEIVQKRRNQESQRVACYLCRSLHDRCSVCAHCHQQLCDLCLKEHVNEDIQKLCEVREITELAADTLEDFKSSRPATDLEREDYTLTARLDTIVAQLRRLHRLVDQRLSTATRLVEKDLQGKSEHPALSVPLISTNVWVREWIKQDVGTSKQTAKSTTMPIQIQQEEKEKQGKKHQRGLQKHLDISRSRNAVEIFVDGVRAKITALDLKTQFETFGEVLDVFVPRKHSGFGYIALLPTGDPSEILWNKMIIHGVKINVRKCYSFDDGKKELVKLKEETKLKIFDKSAKFLKLSVDGIRRQISAEDVRAHFANFGEVLDVKMFMNPVTNEQSGNCHIMLQPTSDCNQILLAEHLIRGVRLNIVEVHACNELDISLVR